MSAANFTLRPAHPNDAPDFARFMSEESVYSNLLQLPFPGIEMWRKKLESLPEGAIHLVAERDGHVIASSGLFPSNPGNLRRRHAMSFGISVAREAQGQGVGTALMTALLDWVDNWAQVLRVELSVFADNERAIRLYERFGFEREGLCRAYAMRNGRLADTVTMARLHPQQRWLQSN
jgi:putative acetyltransferase